MREEREKDIFFRFRKSERFKISTLDPQIKKKQSLSRQFRFMEQRGREGGKALFAIYN